MRINNDQKVLVVILAGGKSRRMLGKDKSLATINKKKLLDICFKRISQQSEMIIINTNNRSLINFDKKKTFVKDHFSGFLGPFNQPSHGLLHGRNLLTKSKTQQGLGRAFILRIEDTWWHGCHACFTNELVRKFPIWQR